MDPVRHETDESLIDVNGVFFVPLDESDHAMFPELYLNTWDGQTDPTNKPAYGIALEESDQGFVYTKVYDTQAEYNAAIEEMELASNGKLPFQRR